MKVTWKIKVIKSTNYNLSPIKSIWCRPIYKPCRWYSTREWLLAMTTTLPDNKDRWSRCHHVAEPRWCGRSYSSWNYAPQTHTTECPCNSLRKLMWSLAGTEYLDIRASATWTVKAYLQQQAKRIVKCTFLGFFVLSRSVLISIICFAARTNRLLLPLTMLLLLLLVLLMFFYTKFYSVAGPDMQLRMGDFD